MLVAWHLWARQLQFLTLFNSNPFAGVGQFQGLTVSHRLLRPYFGLKIIILLPAPITIRGLWGLP